MPGSTIAIAPIPLARSAIRLLVLPGLLALGGAVAVVGGAFLSGGAGIGLVAAGIVVIVLAVYLAVLLFSVRLDVEVSTLRVRWLGGERRYQLARGAVTRVPLRGPGAARLRARFGALGWSVGPATLRGQERIDMVRLASSPSVILVPTDRGRLAIAPRSEQQLLAALGTAARVQQRLDEAAAHTRGLPALPAHPAPPEPVAAATDVVPGLVIAPVEGRVLTGIERALLEERLEAERAVALAAAEAERARVEEARAAAALRATTAPPLPTAHAPSPRADTRLARPGWLRAPSLPRPGAGMPRTLPRAQLVPLALVALPLLAAGGLWLAASLTGRLELAVPQGRLAALTVILGGPGAALGGLLARTWFPRLLGVVLVTALLALLLVGWALFR